MSSSVTGWLDTPIGTRFSRGFLTGLAALVVLMTIAAHLPPSVTVPTPIVATVAQASGGNHPERERSKRPVTVIQAVVLDLDDLASETILPTPMARASHAASATVLRPRSDERRHLLASGLPERPPRA